MQGLTDQMTVEIDAGNYCDISDSNNCDLKEFKSDLVRAICKA